MSLMRLADLVATSRRVTETRSRLEKISALGDLLRRLAPDEIDIAVAFLSGHLRQGRIGLGGAAVRGAMPGSAAAEPALTLSEVDLEFERIGATTGSGSTAERAVKPAHTLDLVILAAEWGHGRRHGWLSNLHLGARDPENGGFVMLGKTFKGLTDERLAWQTQKLQELAMGTDGWTVYVRPELVVEVAFNDVQESPQYPGGMALRFARVKRYREDKTAVEADTIGAVRRIFEAGHGAVPARA